MFASRLFWRSFAAIEAVVVVTAAVAALLSGEPLSFWAPLGCGTLAAIGAAWMVFRPARRTTEALNATLRTLAPFGTVPVSPAPLLGAAAAIDEGVRELQARITALEQRETALAQNTALLETVLGTMVEGVIVVDGQERVLYLNGAARSLLDVPTRDVTGRPLLEIVRSPGIEEGARAALTSRTTHRAEFEIPRKEKAVDLTASPLAGDPERGAVLVLHDVTELRRLERMRREFVSNVSHELKTPLTAIQAYADTLSEGALDDPEHNRVFLDRIVEQSQRLEGLIVDLLRLGRIESQQAVELSPVSLSEVAVTCARDHEAVAAGKGLQLEVNCHESCVILAEAGNLRQVIDNLLDNAIKYTSPGGRITVSVWQETDSGVLEVADTGIGIPREEQGRIFERFYRVDRARARAIGGTGLGLSIVKHIVQQFQGLISVSSELGKGSRFTVRIPLAGS